MRTLRSILLLVLAVAVLHLPLFSQQTTARVSGTVTDASNAILPGARIELRQGTAPPVAATATDSLGQFTLTNLAPGNYTLKIWYVGFSSLEKPVTLTAGQSTSLNGVLKVSSSESVLVTAERAHGEAEAINEEKVADNILNVLPEKVITSLPNANVADAVGRLPGVTLERDEGEGKYVQIRGTEPRLSNLTIDGVEVPSPEGGVRQVKLDTIPADLVQSVQINKTLQANQNGDAIGGSVNLVTKKAGERPLVSVYGLGGFTPIDNTVPVYELGATMGQRFGTQKRLGVMVSGSYDYNGRGIDDIEPVPGILPGTTFTPDFTQMAIRQYLYDRQRFGLGGSMDYRVSQNSNLYLHTLYSDFKDLGNRWEWVINDNGGAPGSAVPAFDTERRNGEYGVANLSVGGNHTFGMSLINWQFAVGRARMLRPIGGGESHTLFAYTGTTSNCQYDAAATTNPYLPQFTPACFTEVYNPANFQLQQIQDSGHGKAAQLNLEGTATFARNYHVGSHTSTFETGFYIRNAHKFDDSFELDYCPTNAATAPFMTQFLGSFKNSNYYSGHYTLGPVSNWGAVNRFFGANNNLFDTVSGACTPQTAPPGGNNNNFDLVERVTSGYVMNSIDFSRFRVVAGVRFEGTQDNTVSCNCGLDPNNPNAGPLTVPGQGSYIDVLPSVSLRMRLDSQDNSALRVVYARGLSRPDPAFLTTAHSVDNSTTPPTLTVGNPALKPEHANNFDILYERYLHPLGAIQAGVFYKSVSDPIVTLLSRTPAMFISQAGNSGSAYIFGVEASFQQHFTYLPSVLSGLGLFANYSYATSKAKNVNPMANRTDQPALLRQAPNTWNISPTYDRKRFSGRVGMAYNGANIFSYGFVPFQSDGTPTPGGIKGPGGDVYLFSHFQVDAQASYYLGKGLTVLASGLNLNNAVFGFYQGSPQFFIQREYYKPTYSFGVRWDLAREK